MPCWDLFDEQAEEYRQALMPTGTPKVAIEAGCSMGWHRYVGEAGGLVTLDRFGHSAPGDVSWINWVLMSAMLLQQSS